MVKLVYAVRRLPSLTLADFQSYWFEQHGPLVRRHAPALRIRRYVQTHRLDLPGLNEALRASRGAGEPYDGVAELWWDSVEDFAGAAATPEGQAAARELLEDERRFIDFARSALWVGEEKVIVE
jgi:uncharacterized protein (TIGR02118 family)